MTISKAWARVTATLNLFSLLRNPISGELIDERTVDRIMINLS
jgi:hypothetical protein